MTASSRRSLPWLAWVAGAILVTMCALLLYESAREDFPRQNLRAFDARRAAQLSEMQRSAYEQELFSELSQWNRLSRRYPTEAGVKQREERWKQLASEGLELAHIALQVLQPNGGFVYPLDGPMARLQVLAEQGDQGAMCLMTGLVAQAKPSRRSAEQVDMARKWLIKGAEGGHAECQLQLGRHTILGLEGFAKDESRGLSLELAARRNGYAHDLGGLITYFQSRWSTDPADLTRLYCWLSVDAQSRLTDGPQQMLRLLRTDAQRLGSEELSNLAGHLESQKFLLPTCVDLSVR
ncbi:hypothetical protein [Variovorax boronicumulans]|uniref:hypothetical protein n=1 Tax=Variovorax boronicumulans TaxID=436515 RepID=UPI00339190EF